MQVTSENQQHADNQNWWESFSTEFNVLKMKLSYNCRQQIFESGNKAGKLLAQQANLMQFPEIFTL